ncbi:hypothetical protein [Arcobacter caeni]|uniref:Thioredoxin domain-containing protein n=1 Tax=Arcobacter caeni TaxID=1912877 RepID=A0A363CXK5_9BACT|nr:hypothetical protein [Arcobacter caeni]PUE63826.1 hypothetical protein B0174_09050 [Arcobacter caeni]
MKNIFKIVFLGIIGFGLLAYLTAPKNPNKNEIDQNKKVLNIDFIPGHFDLVSNNPYTKAETLFKKGVEKYIIVLNHDSLVLFKDLYKYTDKNIVLIANISNTPWLIKQLAVNGKLEEMYKNSKIPLINDSNGFFMNSLDLKDNTQNKYFIYKLNSDGTIIKTDEGLVELNSLEKGISEENSKISLEQIVKSL